MTRRDVARKRLGAALRRVVRALGYDLVARNFYSPVPEWENMHDEVFARRSPLRGIEFDLDSYVGFLDELAPYLTEFKPPAEFVWGNGMYDTVEADVLYAMVRRFQPGRIIELGSGFSSLIIAAAARRNAQEGNPVRYTAYDPFARNFIQRGVEGLELRPESALDVPLREFEALQNSDILFIDTTHTVKLGSEVNYLILDVLPGIAPGVLVHVHDVFLPHEYPRGFLERRLYWAEQYLLQAFLAQNTAWEIILPLSALVRERTPHVAKLVRSFDASSGPGAFWIRRKSLSVADL